MYCAFIDYSKSFDLIDRASLWVKLLKDDVNVKILPVMQYIYIYNANLYWLNDLSYVDETVVLAESASELQLALYALNEWSQRWLCAPGGYV